MELSLYKEDNSEIYVGINPKLENILLKSINNGFIQGLRNIKKYVREKTIMNSRFDF